MQDVAIERWRGPKGERKKDEEREREGEKRDERGVSSASPPPRGLVGLASGPVYRKQMGYACSAPYFTGIYCLLFGCSGYALTAPG